MGWDNMVWVQYEMSTHYTTLVNYLLCKAFFFFSMSEVNSKFHLISTFGDLMGSRIYLTSPFVVTLFVPLQL